MSAFEKQDAIRRMCELQARVVREVTGCDHPADCFCGESGFHPLSDPDDYRNDFKAIEWIEAMVDTELDPRSARSTFSARPTLDIVWRIASRGVGPDTTAEEALDTIARLIELRTARWEEH